MRVLKAESKVMGRVSSDGHLPAMRRSVVSTWGKGHSQRRRFRNKRPQQRSINAPSNSACETGLGSSAPMNAIVMAGAPRGKGRRNINDCSMGFSMLFQAWLGVILLPLALLGWSPGLNS